MHRFHQHEHPEHRRSSIHRRGPGRHGMGGHRARRGAVATAILALLAERPMHGYELIAELDERSGGRWRPSPGAIYPALSRLEEAGLIEPTGTADSEGRKTYTVTEDGRRRAEVEQEHAREPWERAGHGRLGELRRDLAELVGQIRQISRFGTPAQVERAKTVIRDTKRALYDVLATTNADAGDTDEPDAGATDTNATNAADDA